MSNLFSDDSSGYRLKALQILNWGVFDKTVKTFVFDDKSTILTGYNGTGKTTVVDAILTLLIPSNLRWYNLSSDSVKKRERDVENYVRGAYGNSGDGTTNYLRDKNTLSIINGIFEDPSEDKVLSLLQVRYFISDRLDTKYAISDKELTIEEINRVFTKSKTNISSDGKWRKELAQNVGTRFFESFSSYKTYFMDKFGFRSDNALKLFAQTVGMKVLGDITSFVRSNMLEDKSPNKEFTELDEEFNKLIMIEQDIKKGMLKLERLEKINHSGEVWNKSRTLKEQYESKIKGEDIWFIESAVELGRKELKENEIEKSKALNRAEDNKCELELCMEKIYSLKSDQATTILSEYESQIKEYENTLNEISIKHDRYKALVEKLLANGVEIQFAESQEEFYVTKDKIKLLKEKVESNKTKAETAKIDYSYSIRDLNESLNLMEKELSYLSLRDTNIPQQYDEIRNNIQKNTGIKKLFYLGELISIKDNKDEFSDAIIKAVNSRALHLLCEKKEEKTIIEYLDKTNIGIKLSLIVIDDYIFESNHQDNIFNYIEIKQKDNPYKDYITNYLDSNFNFVLSNNIDEFLISSNAILPSCIFSINGEKQKDDSKLDVYLGWDNKKRREELQFLIQGQYEEKTDLSLKIKDAEKKIKKALSICSLLDQLDEYDDWTKIDKAPLISKIEKVKNQRDEFLLKNKDLEERKRQLEREIERKEILQNEQSELQGNIRELKNKIDKLTIDIDNFNQRLNTIDSDPFCKEIFLETEKLSKISSLDDLLSLHSKLSSSYKEELINLRERELKNRSQLERLMVDFISPAIKQGEEQLNWSGEYSYLIPEVDYLSDFNKEYYSIKDDKLVELKLKFDEYLTISLKNTFGTLNERITSWDKEIRNAIRILNRNLLKIPFDKDNDTHLQLEIKSSYDKDFKEFENNLVKAIPNIRDLVEGNEEKRKEIYSGIKSFLDKYRLDDNLRAKVLDLRRKYIFSAKEINKDDSIIQYYQDTSSLSGGEKAKLTYTILAASIAYQFNLDNYDENFKGPFRFVILDEAFSKSDARNSEYALQLFKELDLQLMVITPRNGINIVEGYVSSLHLLEKNSDGRTSSISSMKIEEYKEVEVANT